MTNKRQTVYGISCGKTGNIVYIGVSGDPITRFKSHIAAARHYKQSNPIYIWLRDALKTKNPPELIVLEEGVLFENRLKYEQKWIRRFSGLLNRANLGAGQRDKLANLDPIFGMSEILRQMQVDITKYPDRFGKDAQSHMDEAKKHYGKYKNFKKISEEILADVVINAKKVVVANNG